MAKLFYEIVQHDGGWAYKVGETYSETFPSHEDALRAAETAAAEQRVAGSTDGIQFEDAEGRWHDEVARGDDRPDTEVSD
ncbi:DUF2188 domain-containing protein [Aminobacter sp. Piv2-1]|uniref:DUF2188 domain-containing protein n=1 Tax=Aminobacter sp. Piv2-1 TaxID=3031122 RepID=UPI0030ABFFD9